MLGRREVKRKVSGRDRERSKAERNISGWKREEK